jgi:hypothetical protein
MEEERTMREKRGNWILGLVLILLGLVFLAQQFYPDVFGDWMWLAGLGLIFLVAYVFSRQYGFLIPGCILGALGIGVGLIETGMLTGEGEDGVIVLALGLGFLAIWLIDLLVARGRAAGWWPIIPGGILALVGAGILSGNEAWMDDIGQWWPVIFIIVGVWILLERIIRRPS